MRIFPEDPCEEIWACLIGRNNFRNLPTKTGVIKLDQQKTVFSFGDDIRITFSFTKEVLVRSGLREEVRILTCEVTTQVTRHVLPLPKDTGEIIFESEYACHWAVLYTLMSSEQKALEWMQTRGQEIKHVFDAMDNKIERTEKAYSVLVVDGKIDKMEDFKLQAQYGIKIS